MIRSYSLGTLPALTSVRRIIMNNKFAKSMSAAILSNCHNAVLDLAFLIEAQEEDELPERVLASFRGNWP